LTWRHTYSVREAPHLVSSSAAKKFVALLEKDYVLLASLCAYSCVATLAKRRRTRTYNLESPWHKDCVLEYGASAHHSTVARCAAMMIEIETVAGLISDLQL
jgi:hypothetical protein